MGAGHLQTRDGHLIRCPSGHLSRYCFPFEHVRNVQELRKKGYQRLQIDADYRNEDLSGGDPRHDDAAAEAWWNQAYGVIQNGNNPGWWIQTVGTETWRVYIQHNAWNTGGDDRFYSLHVQANINATPVGILRYYAHSTGWKVYVGTMPSIDTEAKYDQLYLRTRLGIMTDVGDPRDYPIIPKPTFTGEYDYANTRLNTLLSYADWVANPTDPIDYVNYQSAACGFQNTNWPAGDRTDWGGASGCPTQDGPSWTCTHERRDPSPHYGWSIVKRVD